MAMVSHKYPAANANSGRYPKGYRYGTTLKALRPKAANINTPLPANTNYLAPSKGFGAGAASKALKALRVAPYIGAVLTGYELYRWYVGQEEIPPNTWIVDPAWNEMICGAGYAEVGCWQGIVTTEACTPSLGRTGCGTNPAQQNPPNGKWFLWGKKTNVCGICAMPRRVLLTYQGTPHPPVPTWSGAGVPAIPPVWVPAPLPSYVPALDPMALPIGQPVPATVPLPRPASVPRARPMPGRSPTEQPQRGPVPRVRPRPRHRPGRASVSVVTINRLGLAHAFQGSHNPVPPARGTKEHKVIVRTGSMKAVRAVVGAIHEVLELQQAIYDSLPRSIRRRYETSAYDRHGRYTGRGGSTPMSQAQAIWRHWRDVNVETAIANLAANHIEDKVFGAIGRVSKRASRRAGLTFGFQTGPAH